ncbi:MAG: hypothetical protein CVT48_06320 [Thermoplasmata archaeon HGW-Thermoplasmata-1]|nr:MAG: hypothetical protein CVT48_06320 [Thermoplasmata archaeon HGW-Thermoplasmata-1]
MAPAGKTVIYRKRQTITCDKMVKCYICSAEGIVICQHCSEPICGEHAYLIEELGDHLCLNCYSASRDADMDLDES